MQRPRRVHCPHEGSGALKTLDDVLRQRAQLTLGFGDPNSTSGLGGLVDEPGAPVTTGAAEAAAGATPPSESGQERGEIE